MAINKVEFGGRTLIDLTDTTATADKILTGYGAYGKDGVWVDGTAIESSPDGSVYQDAEGYVVLDDGAGTHVEVESLSVTENGTYTAPTGYAYSPVSVDVEPNLITKTVTPTETTTTYTASEEQNTILSIPSGVYFDSVQGSKWVIDTARYTSNSSFVVGNTYTIHGQIVTTSSSALDITIDISGEWSLTNWTATGTYYYAILPKTVTGSDASYVTNVDLMYYPDNNKYSLRIILNTITGSSHSHQFITDTEVQFVDESISIDGYSAFTVNAMPSGTAGTPIATKGTVSNNSISVTPSVTNTTGYITGGTKTGIGVTVSASELVSGSQTITTNDTYDVTNLASVTVNVSGGGGSTSKKQINFIDYDGTIVQSYTSAEWANVSALPNNPSHTGLVAQGWNWTKAQIDAQLTALPDGDIWIGQMYITESGDTEIDVRFSDSARLSPILTICVNGSITVDWGDNTSPDTVTGTSLSTYQAAPHTYSSTGNYTMVIHVVSGSFRFYGSISYQLLRKNAMQVENLVYANCVEHIRFGSGATSIGANAFNSCHSLSSITIPNSITSIANDAFNACHSLSSITIPSSVTSIGNSTFFDDYSLSSIAIPSGVTSIGTYAFYTCYSLSSITMPSGVTSIGSNTFYSCRSLLSATIPSGITSIGSNMFNSCYSLSSITIPSSVTSIGGNAFNACASLSSIAIPSGITSIGTSAFSGCNSLSSIIIPSAVTSIGNYAFNNCCGMAEYHILPTDVPTLGTTVFSSIASDCKIYVPLGTISDYQSATNWSEYASYMVEESA